MTEPAADAGSAPLAGPLAPPVRARVLSLAAAALGNLPLDQLPGALRRVAGFAPARRVRLAANQIAAALETDDEFRNRIAIQARAQLPELASALELGMVPAAADPLDLASLAYLLRPPGWQATVDGVGGSTGGATESGGPSEAAVTRLSAQLAKAKSDARANRERLESRLSEVRADNAELRRKAATLGQQLKSAEAAADRSAQDQTADRARAESAAARTDAEARRLRARISDQEAEAAAHRRAAREGRQAGNIRARLLLDTLVESAEGLRRELALPPVSGRPADSIDAVVPPSQQPSGSRSRARLPEDPELVEELLGLPRVHLVVDGYNVTKTAWPTTTLETQRSRLLDGLAAIVARTACEVTVVFDGAELTHPPAVRGPRGVRVRFSPPGVIADDVIRDLVAAEPDGRPLVVASSDREVATAVERSGAWSVPASALVGFLTRS